MEKKFRDIKKPGFMKEAITSRSHGVATEILIAFLVFFVSSTFASVVQMPAMMIHLFSSQEYLEMVSSSSFNFSVDMEKIMEIATNMPDWIIIVTLASQIGLIVTAILYCRLFEKRKAHTMGFCKKGIVSQYLLGIIMGAVAFCAAYVICLLTGSVEFFAKPSKGFSILYLVGFLLGYLIQGMAEEVFCRGYLLVSLTKRYSVTFSVVISSLFFALLHGMNAGMTALSYVNLFLCGALFALLFIRFENIWIVGAFHSIWNFVQGNILGVSVSGMGLQRSLFTSKFVEGADAINGGKFGLEGGLSVTLVLGLFIAVLLWNMSRKGYFVEAEPVENKYDKMHYEKIMNQYNMYQNRMNNQNYNNPYQNPTGNQNSDNLKASSQSNNMPNEDGGINKEENTWNTNSTNGQQTNPANSQNTQTAFDQSYFKE